MPITKEDKILIKNLFTLEGYNAKQLIRKFPSRGWNMGSIYKLLQKQGWSTAASDNAVPAQHQSRFVWDTA